MPISSAPAQEERLRQQDGIIANLDVNGEEAVFGWRFAQRPPALVSKVEATFNGRPVGTPTGYELFPAEGENAIVTFMIDVGGLERAIAIDEAERAVLDVVPALPRTVQSRIASYDTDFHPIDIHDASSAYIELRAAAGPKDVASNLSRSLQAAIVAASSEPATRHAIYVYTDGFNADAKSFRDLEALAHATRVSVSFVLEPSMRLADLALLGHFAKASGGRLLARTGFVRDDILVFLTSGARVRFPLGMVRRYIWEKAGTLDVSLVYGDQTLSVTAPFDAPLAGPGETIARIWTRDPTLVIISGLVVLVILAGAVVLRLLVKQRKKTLPRTGRTAS